mgnify:FL=1|tara:strand:- start:1512 stop:1736 length:225 start_codon:yes stop_codon:yes gene_type:complete
MKKHQIKSGWYYIFWGIMAASVVAGQLYVGKGYRQLSNSMEKIILEGDTKDCQTSNWRLLVERELDNLKRQAPR